MLLDFVPKRNLFAVQGTKGRSWNNISISSPAFSFHHSGDKIKMKEDRCSEVPRQAGGRQQQEPPEIQQSPAHWKEELLPTTQAENWQTPPLQSRGSWQGFMQHHTCWMCTSQSSPHPGEPLHSHQLTLNTQEKSDNPAQNCSSWLPTSPVKHRLPVLIHLSQACLLCTAASTFMEIFFFVMWSGMIV